VDKPGFFHNFNGLCGFKAAGEPWWLRCTEGEQNRRQLEKTGFCTFHPVDMHWVLHRPEGMFAMTALFRSATGEIFFLKQASQVYNQ